MPEGLSVHHVLPETIISSFPHIARTDFPAGLTCGLIGDDMELISAPIGHGDLVVRRSYLSYQARPAINCAPSASVSYWFEELSPVA